jgi:hypothetical protein
MSTVELIWACTLLVVIVVIVPLAIVLLHRTFSAAWSIRRYLREMLEAGVGIAGNTASITALNDTIRVAGSLVATADSIKQHSGAIVTVLAGRAARGKQP